MKSKAVRSFNMLVSIKDGRAFFYRGNLREDLDLANAIFYRPDPEDFAMVYNLERDPNTGEVLDIKVLKDEAEGPRLRPAPPETLPAMQEFLDSPEGARCVNNVLDFDSDWFSEYQLIQ
jgi:hypothetical protein